MARRKTKRPRYRFLANPQNRPLFVMLIAVVVLVIVLGVNALTGQSISLNTTTYSYHQGNVSFSFEYPTDFNDSTPPKFNPNDGTVVAQRQLKHSDGSTTGYVRGSYFPHQQSSGDPEDEYLLLRRALRGRPSDIQHFATSFFVKDNTDCTHAAILTTSSGAVLLKCNLLKFWSNGGVHGNVLYGANSSGTYQFDYYIRNQYWQAHTDAWPVIYKDISYQ